MKGLRFLALAGAALSGVLLAYCSVRKPEQRSASAVISAPRATPSGAASAAIGVQPSELAEERHASLLLRPGFEEVVRALDDRDELRAATLFADRLAAAPPAESDATSYQHLSAVLFERAKRHDRALAGYERAARPDYVLASYARAGKVRALLALGRASEALAEARLLGDEPALAAERRALLSAAALGAAPRDEALRVVRAAVAEASSAVERRALGEKLAEALLDARAVDAGASPNVSADQALEALALARVLGAESAANEEVARRAAALEKRALLSLPPELRTRHALPSVNEEVARATALTDARRFGDALAVAASVRTRLSPVEKNGSLGCDLSLVRAKAHAGLREYGKARGAAAEAGAACRVDAHRHARALYLAGKYAASEGSYLQAARAYELLEREHPKNSLADDGRLLAALAYRELGIDARFTELLSKLPDDYPDGDMAVEGLFRLAIDRVDRNDWSGAASVLGRATKLVGDGDVSRGLELAGRERYFEGRAELALGQRERALTRFEEVVRDAPFSYYMLHAYSRLLALAPDRARAAREHGLERAKGSIRPAVPARVLSHPSYARALALLRVSETQAAWNELEISGLSGPGAGPELLWAAAQAFARAGAFKLAHDIARSRLTDWLSRWPHADWADAWRVAFPRPYRELVAKKCSEPELSHALVFAIMREESAFDPDAESPADAHGLMQLIPPTARVAAKGTNLPHDRRALKRPSVNVALGCRTLARFSRGFPDAHWLGVPAYNAGPSRVKRWLADRPIADMDLWVELIPYLETRRYTKRVLASRAVYAFLYDGENAEEALILPERLAYVASR